jgi:hypothetical protein
VLPAGDEIKALVHRVFEVRELGSDRLWRGKHAIGKSALLRADGL